MIKELRELMWIYISFQKLRGWLAVWCYDYEAAIHQFIPSQEVCVWCSFHVFGAFSLAWSCTFLTVSVPHSFLEEDDDSVNSWSWSCLSMDEARSSVCFGVLLSTCHRKMVLECLMELEKNMQVKWLIFVAEMFTRLEGTTLVEAFLHKYEGFCTSKCCLWWYLCAK